MPRSREANAKHAARQRTEAKAKRGDINAQFNLAVRYLCGEGCEVNSSKARDWFEKAANQGDADAQFVEATGGMSDDGTSACDTLN